MDETSLHSAKAVSEHYKKKADEIEKLDAITNKSFQLSSEQIALLKKSNEFAEDANNEAKKASADSERASKSALVSKRISIASLIVAIVSLLYGFFN